MARLVSRTVATFCLLAACTQTQPADSSVTASHRAAPAKCSACHLAPKEHSLADERWERYLKNHKRRLRLSDEEKVFLYDFLVGGPRPATREGTE